MKNLTAILITFLRPEYTRECVRTLRESYGEIKILVAENAHYSKELKDYVNEQGGQYFLMPYDSGVCYARNRLMELVDTEYVLIGDDDFYYTDHARVENMLIFLQTRKEFDLIGGRINEHNNIKDYQGHIDIHPDHLHYRKIQPEEMEYDKTSRLAYAKCDITFNYFIARTERVREVKWDEKIKVAYEHSDWFISMKKAGRSVAYTPDAVVIHKPSHVTIKDLQLYNQHRFSVADKYYFFEKHSLNYSINFNGIKTIRRRETGNKKRYYMKTRGSFDGRQYNAGDIVITDRPTENMVEL